VGKGISATSDYTAPNRSAEECRLVGERHPRNGEVKYGGFDKVSEF